MNYLDCKKVLKKFDFNNVKLLGGDKIVIYHVNGGPSVIFKKNKEEIDECETLGLKLRDITITQFEEYFKQCVLWDDNVGGWNLKYEYLFHDDPNYDINTYPILMDLMNEVREMMETGKWICGLDKTELMNIPDQYRHIVNLYKKLHGDS